MKRLQCLYEDQRKKERSAMRERAAKHQKHMDKIEESRDVKRRERRKHAFFLLGQAEKRQNHAE